MTSSKLICNGELEITKITEQLYDEVEQLYRKFFINYENVCLATNLLKSQPAIDELIEMLRYVLKDGISFAAIERSTGKIVAICVNKIVNPSKNLTFDEIFRTFKSPIMLYIGEYLERMENTYDLFNEWEIDCVMEIEFITVHANWGKRGIAAALAEYSIDYARRMLAGNLEDIHTLPANVRTERPKAVCSVFTSLFTQKMGDKLGFETINSIAFKEFAFDGSTFAEKIDAVHEYSKFAALRL